MTILRRAELVKPSVRVKASNVRGQGEQLRLVARACGDAARIAQVRPLSDERTTATAPVGIW